MEAGPYGNSQAPDSRDTASLATLAGHCSCLYAKVISWNHLLGHLQAAKTQMRELEPPNQNTTIKQRHGEELQLCEQPLSQRRTEDPAMLGCGLPLELPHKDPWR